MMHGNYVYGGDTALSPQLRCVMYGFFSVEIMSCNSSGQKDDGVFYR